MAATAAVLNSIPAGNDVVAAYPSNGINDEAQSIFYVLEDCPIKTVADIVGKTIAVSTLDEPLGALDAMTKLTMQEDIVRIWREEKVTIVLVMHDLEEAIFLADRVPVLPREKVAGRRLIDIDLPRPRDRSKRRFVTKRKRLMAKFGLH